MTTSVKHPVPVFIGYTVSTRPDLHDHVPEIDIPVPGQLKKQDSIDDWLQNTKPGLIEKKRQEFMQESAYCKITGHITRVVAMAPSLGPEKGVYDSNLRDPDDSPAVDFLSWLLEHFPQAFSTYARDRTVNGVVFFGFYPKEFVRVSGTEAAATPGVEVPIGYWYLNEDCLNPYEMLVEDKRRSFVTLQKVCRQVGIPIADNFQTHQDPMEDIRIVTELVSKYKLIGVDDMPAMASVVPEIPVPEVVAKSSETAEEVEEAEEEAAVEPQPRTRRSTKKAARR